MAANSKSRGIANLGKRLISNRQIWTRDPTHCSLHLPAAFTLSHIRRAVHSSYEKNVDEHTHHTVVPDEVIQPQSDKYWAPHPQTGVFGPDAVDSAAATATGERGFHSSQPVNTGTDNADSVLEQQAWFRPASMEDLEKPHGLH